MAEPQLFHLAAFADGNEGGNPAGVWIGEELPPPAEMQRIAADVGASETAFIAPSSGERRIVRYYSPEVEIPFCGHATIASGVVLGRDSGAGRFLFDTLAGEVEVTVSQRGNKLVASLRSVATRHKSIDDDTLQQLLDCLGWSCDDLDANLPPVNAYAGAWHYLIAVASRDTLARLDYDFDALKALMQRNNITTVQLLWPEHETLYHSRNPFPIGGVVEDPATGAAAAALGGYLRDAGLVTTPFEFVIRQGEDMGMPSLLHVNIPESGGILVSGTARDLATNGA